MKTRKFTKVVSFILALTILATTLLVNSFKVSAAVTPVETQCIRCDATLGWSGPYLGSVPTPNDSTFGGAYVVDSDRDEWHYYIIKCPDFKNTLLGKKHDNYPAVERHNYTSTYTQYDSSRHTRTYTCTKNNAAYNIVGTEGCGYTKDVLEAHYASWQRRAAATDDHHVIQQMCICGYVISSTPEKHTFEDAKYYHYNINQHHITKFCTVCQDTIHIYENHKFTYGDWTNNSSTQHKRTATCSDCGYTKTEYADHNLSTSDPIRYGTEDENYATYSGSEYHRYDITCSDCDYESSKYEPHEMYVEKPWFDSDATYHNQITRCAKCSYGVSTYRYHNYPKELYTYVSLNATTHSITKHCDTCTRTVDGGTAKHNFIVGEWTKFDGSDPNAGTYDCNKYHKRTLTCSDCGYVKYEYVAHNMYIDSYTSQNADRHSCVPKCTDCSYSYNLNEPHKFNLNDYKYEVIDKNFHKFIKPCEKCDYAYEINEYHEDSDSDCYCDDCGYLMTKFSVTVPTSMVLTMGTDGKVYSPSDVVIVNNSTAAVSLKKADINSRNGWNIVPYSTNMAKEKVDSKKIGFKMNGIQTDSAGTTDSLSYNNSWIIEKGKSSAVVYDAVVSATSTPIDEQVIEIVYIVDWKE